MSKSKRTQSSRFYCDQRKDISDACAPKKEVSDIDMILAGNDGNRQGSQLGEARVQRNATDAEVAQQICATRHVLRRYTRDGPGNRVVRRMNEDENERAMGSGCGCDDSRLGACAAGAEQGCAGQEAAAVVAVCACVCVYTPPQAALAPPPAAPTPPTPPTPPADPRAPPCVAYECYALLYYTTLLPCAMLFA